MKDKMTEKSSEIKTIVGEVISDKMDKSVVVNVNRVKQNRLYKKKYQVSKKFIADDQKNQYKVGDIVEIQGVKPISKNKAYIVVGKVK